MFADRPVPEVSFAVQGKEMCTVKLLHLFSVQLHTVWDFCYNGKQMEGRGRERRKGRKTVASEHPRVR